MNNHNWQSEYSRNTSQQAQQYQRQSQYQHQMPSASYASPASQFSAALDTPVATSLQHALLQQLSFQQQRPTTSSSGFTRGQTLPREVCRDFTVGKCDRGTCKFLHAASMLPVVPPAPREACGDYLRGKCNRTTCKFVHALPTTTFAGALGMGISPLSLPVAPYVCIFLFLQS